MNGEEFYDNSQMAERLSGYFSKDALRELCQPGDPQDRINRALGKSPLVDLSDFGESLLE